jgi:hypothetical protein
MKGFRTNSAALLGGLYCSLLLLSACDTSETSKGTIEERATARWEALLGDDLADAYEFLSPGTRSSVSSAQYQRSILSQKVQWTGARFIESECVESSCKVRISLDFALHGVLPGVKSYEGTREIEESWVLVEGNWYLVP